MPLKVGTEGPLTCLGIESTAHTFGCGVVRVDRAGGRILSDIRSLYKPQPGAGIHPREASRHHTSVAAETVRTALTRAGIRMGDVDLVAYSAGPGLGPCLRVGGVVARTLAHTYRKPLVPANHAVGHIELGCLLCGADDPITVLVSGGHTLVSAYSLGRWRIFGETLDLTLGQLVDQLGREMGFASPSGARIEELARQSSEYQWLPYTVKGQDVSYSGILTAAKRLLSRGTDRSSVSFSLQETAFAMLIETSERALAFTEKGELLLTGGVAANSRLQEMMGEMCRQHSSRFYVIPREYSGDCGSQIAWTGVLGYLSGMSVRVDRAGVRQSWRIDQVDAPWRS